MSKDHWDGLTDAELLAANLTTDDPESTPDLVRHVPQGEEEPYVLYTYDLRGSGKDELVCAHSDCHQKHLQGAVMCKEGLSFLVGWQCATTLYGVNFDKYMAAYHRAEKRQADLLETKALNSLIAPLLGMLDDIRKSNIFTLYVNLVRQVEENFPWVYENVDGDIYYYPEFVSVPYRFLDEDFEEEVAGSFDKICREVDVLLSRSKHVEAGADATGRAKKTLLSAAKRLGDVINRLEDAVTFFQPAVLETICTAANAANPKQRYTAGMLSLTREKKGRIVTVRVPPSYKVPDRQRLDAIIEALR